jgi:flagellar hook-basal body complex protein FliE
MDEYKSRLATYLTGLVREELEKYVGGYTDEWNDQRKKNAEVLGYKLAGTSDISEEIIDWQGKYDDEFKFKKGQLIRDINPDCPHHGSEGEVTKVTKDEVTYTVRNNGKTYKVGDELTKTKVQLTPLKEGLGDKFQKTIDKYNKNAKKNKDAMDAARKRKRNKSGQFEDVIEINGVKYSRVVQEDRDYKAEYQARKSTYYDKYQSSTKAKKYRAELNQYNRKKGTYGNGDKKDASHKGGKIVGFENQSVNRSRKEKSRMKKENIRKFVNEAVEPQGNMAKIAKIVKRKQATKLSGVMIDMQSASLLMKLWDAVSDKDKEKMNKLNAKVLTTVIKKLWSRVNLKLPI